MPGEHAKYSPSAMEYQRHCSLFRSRNEDSEASIRGTAIHEVIETGAEPPEEFFVPVSYAREVVLPWCYAQMPLAKPEHEVRVHTPHPDCWGTADLILDGGTKALLCDWKTGHSDRPVAMDCMQLAIYATALAFMRPAIKEITVVLAELDRGTFTHHTFGTEYLKGPVWGVVQLIIEAIDLGEAIRPGKYCGYCEHGPTCPALRRVVDQIDIRTGVDDLTTTAILEAMDKAGLLDAWLKSVKGRAYLLAEANSLPGWGLKPGRPTRKWRDHEEAVAAIREAARIKKKEVDPFKPAELKSPAEIEKEVGKSKPVKAVLDRYITRTPGRMQLVKETP